MLLSAGVRSACLAGRVLLTRPGRPAERLGQTPTQHMQHFHLSPLSNPRARFNEDCYFNRLKIKHIPTIKIVGSITRLHCRKEEFKKQ